VVAQLVDDVAVMYAGRIVEFAPVTRIFVEPAHPYTVALRDCIPEPALQRRRLATIAGQAPRAGEIEHGCRFVPRCPRAQADCTLEPPMVAIGPAHTALCRYPVLSGGAR
jgi:peptide/nickel transport system ATP-binding protein